MRVVVTGGAGFIGANLCRHLVARPEVSAVVVVDDLSSGALANLDRVGAEALVGSILDEAVLDRALDGAASVVHLAARPSVPRSIADPVASHDVNATGTMRVLEAVCKPYEIEGRSISVAVSIGIALAPQHGSTVAELTRAGDHAMYAAKRRGGASIMLSSLWASPTSGIVETTEALSLKSDKKLG